MIKRHQNVFSKKVADHFQYFCIKLNRSDIVFANQMGKMDSCLMNVEYVALLLLWNESVVKVR